MSDATPPPISAAQSIAGVMARVQAVAKDSENKQQNFKFRGIDAVMNAVGPALREVGGFIAPGRVIDKSYEHGVTSKGSATIEARITVEYRWFGTDGGEPIVSEIPAEATDMSDKATAKAMSVAYRTYLLQILTLPTDDPDPDSEYIDRGTAGEKPVRKTAAPKGPAKPLKDWWLLGASAKTVEELTDVFNECQAAGQLALVCPYDADSGTANEFLRKMKTLKFAAAEVPTPTTDDPALTGGGWPVAPIPADPESGEVA